MLREAGAKPAISHCEIRAALRKGVMLVSSPPLSNHDGSIRIAALRHWTSAAALSYGERQTGEEATKDMSGKNVKIRSSGGGEFDCYLNVPHAGAKVPAIVIASAVHGVDADVRAIAEEFGSQGYIAAAPDLFWRSVPGPLARDDERTKQRSQPRLEKIKTGEADLADTLAELRKLPQSNGRTAVMGLCYGGPYAILGPKRLGYDAGISCHGSQMLDYIRELEGLDRPVCIIWGDEDHQAPAEVLDAYRGAAGRSKNLDLHIFPGVLHGYMMPEAGKAFDRKTREFSMACALAILEALRSAKAGRKAG
jgi:carboxymethylenebutenolidase